MSVLRFNANSAERALERPQRIGGRTVAVTKCVGLAAVFAICCGELCAENVVFATYNLENYGPANRVLADGFHPDYPKPETEKAALRRVMESAAADVLVVEEMGPEPYLAELRRDLRREGCDYPYFAIGTAADADRHVAVLSRRPLSDVATLDLKFEYLGGIERVKRGVLVATISTTGGDVTLFAVHLKSRLTERREDPDSKLRRTLEATAVRDAVLRRFPQPTAARFVILGDFNDTQDTKPIARLLRRGETEISTLVPAADSRGETWTYHYAREQSYSRIDYVLVSPLLRGAIVDGGARIVDGADVMAASDHRPVAVTLTFGGK